jgi:ubiquinone/menaquinone biosynthesis C-methylase UbiE
MQNTSNVKNQYSDDNNLSARQNLHLKYSTNQQGLFPWLFEQYTFHENDFLLELGCGNGGQWVGRISSLPNGAKLVLSDFSDGMLNAVQMQFSEYPQVSFRNIDIQNIPFEDNSFDVIIANHMLYHVPDMDKGLSEVRRVLKPGGRFYSSTIGSGGMRAFLHKAFISVNPKSTAFNENLQFTLQNGAELLKKYFSYVERRDYIDSLQITETADLINWIESTISISNYTKDDRAKLYPYFESIRTENGYIEIEKEAGLFICGNDLTISRSVHPAM